MGVWGVAYRDTAKNNKPLVPFFFFFFFFRSSSYADDSSSTSSFLFPLYSRRTHSNHHLPPHLPIKLSTMVSTKSVALFALVAFAGAGSALADKHGEAVAGESSKALKSPKLKLDKHAKGEAVAGEALKPIKAKAFKGGKADEAGEALKAKAPKVGLLSL